jgi:hypothetical protein
VIKERRWNGGEFMNVRDLKPITFDLSGIDHLALVLSALEASVY